MNKNTNNRSYLWVILLILGLFLIAQSRLSKNKIIEGFQSFASATGWPFDRVLLPINYLLADAYPWSNFYPVSYDYWTGLPYQVVLPGPWYQMTRY